MKLIKKVRFYNSTRYFYKNKVIKIVYDNNEIFWIKGNYYHKEDGPACQNCYYCINNCHIFANGNNKYNRHFFINDFRINEINFAKETNHIICLICNDFCKQECFI